MLEALGAGFAHLIDPVHLGMLCLGVLFGLLLGIIPGIGGTVGLCLLLPFVFALPTPTSAIALLIGMCAVTQTSDAITAVLLGIPGTAGGVATILDGAPMGRKGEAGRAMGAAFMASAIFLSWSRKLVK